jgi:hypothetical protein
MTKILVHPRTWRATRLASTRSDEDPDEDVLTAADLRDRSERVALGAFCGKR